VQTSDGSLLRKVALTQGMHDRRRSGGEAEEGKTSERHVAMEVASAAAAWQIRTAPPL